jgi:hypothetical protein
VPVDIGQRVGAAGFEQGEVGRAEVGPQALRVALFQRGQQLGPGQAAARQREHLVAPTVQRHLAAVELEGEAPLALGLGMLDQAAPALVRVVAPAARRQVLEDERAGQGPVAVVELVRRSFGQVHVQVELVEHAGALRGRAGRCEAGGHVAVPRSVVHAPAAAVPVFPGIEPPEQRYVVGLVHGRQPRLQRGGLGAGPGDRLARRPRAGVDQGRIAEVVEDEGAECGEVACMQPGAPVPGHAAEGTVGGHALQTLQQLLVVGDVGQVPVDGLPELPRRRAVDER